MWLIRLLVAYALQVFKIPVVRLTLFLCLGALSKAFAATFIDSLRMDNFAHEVFIWLQHLTLLGFCIEVIRYILEKELGISIDKPPEYLKRLFKSK